MPEVDRRRALARACRITFSLCMYFARFVKLLSCSVVGPPRAATEHRTPAARRARVRLLCRESNRPVDILALGLAGEQHAAEQSSATGPRDAFEAQGRWLHSREGEGDRPSRAAKPQSRPARTALCMEHTMQLPPALPFGGNETSWETICTRERERRRSSTCLPYPSALSGSQYTC